MESTQQDEELVGANANSRNWKGIIISLLVILAVGLLILIAVLLQKPPQKPFRGQKPLSLDDIINYSFEPRRFTGHWINSHMFSYQSNTLNIMSFDCQTMAQKIILSNYTIRQLVGDRFKYFMTSDPSVVLLAYDIKQLYRHSIIARYKLFNTISNMSFDVIPNNNYHSNSEIQNVALSPNSRKLAFVYENNIYVMSKFYDGLRESTQITFDGKENTIYNGITDWLYEEEILYQTNALWWSPDSSKLAYIKFNDSRVDYYSFSVYDNSQYGSVNKVRYPKPDTVNPQATLYVHNTEIGDTLKLHVPKSVTENFKDYYIWNVKWLSFNSIITVYVNRKQDKAVTVINDATTGYVVREKEYPTAPQSHNDAWFLPHGLLSSSIYNFYFQIWPYEGFKTIISFDTRTGEAHPITQHHFDVTDLLSFSEKNGDIYYLATNGDPKQRHLFRKNVNNFHSQAECLTCSFHNQTIDYFFEDPSAHQSELIPGEFCSYNAAIFSSTSEFFILECLGDKVPVIYVKSSENKHVEYVLDKNEDLKQLLESKILPKRSYMRVYLDNSSNLYSDAEILYPPVFEMTGRTYPVLVYVYNGPASQIVDFQFKIRKFESYLAVNFGIIVAIMDGRGSDANGDKFLKAVSKRLGELETEDQLHLVSALKREIYTDDSRFAIWGWSYGGFLAAMALFLEKTPFKCAVSGAPVSDWLLYDSAYTERYLGSYAQNRHAYERSNLTHLAKHNGRFFAKRKMLLIHGTGDDNVHFQHSALLAKVLRNTKLDLEFEVYPDVPHTPDEETQRYLYQKVAKFLLSCYSIDYSLYLEQLNYHHLINDDLNEEANEE